MERLTKYEPCEGGIPLVTVEDEQSALQRLAAYEDAEEQGRMITRICVICRESTGIDYRIDQSCICARCAEKLRKLLYESETAEGKDDG